MSVCNSGTGNHDTKPSPHSCAIFPIVDAYILGPDGVLASYLAKKLDEKGIEVSLLITVDAANGRKSNKVNRKISKNVKRNINYYTTNKPKGLLKNLIGSFGDSNVESVPYQVENRDQTENTLNNEAVDHYNIDDATADSIIKEITNLLKGMKEGESKKLSKEEIKKLGPKK